MNHVIRAYENAVFVMGVNRVGKEDGRLHFGSTMIVNSYGEVLEKAGEKEEKIVSAVVDLDHVGRESTVFGDYRPEMYHRIIEPPKGRSS